MFTRPRLIATFIFLAPWSCLIAAEPRLLSVEKIWDAAPHNAFTDLERFDGRWFCAFREGSGHAGAGDHGKIRVITSADGVDWKSAALLESPGLDLRDAKLSVTPDGHLLLNSCEYDVDHDDPNHRNNQSVSFLSKDGNAWDGPHRVADAGYWLWQTTWNGATGYALGYKWGNHDATRFYTTSDGRHYETHVDHIRPPRDRSNEHALVFRPDGTAHMLLRRDHSDPASSGALFGTAKPPYRDWEWKNLGIKTGGPAMLSLPDGRLLTAVRRYPSGSENSAWTELGFIDSETARYRAALKLPSGGDTSYAGLVWHGGVLWMSYYSSHEGKTSIYLAKVAIPGAHDDKTKAVALGTRRELFVDRHLIDRLEGAELRLHHPQRRGPALAFDHPWEGIYSAYPTVLKDGETYHLYYRGMPRATHDLDTEVTCYAKSTDGITWDKPELGLFEVNGTTKNNVILARTPACHNFAPFLDTNPATKSTERFKALGGTNELGLFAFVSADGVRWKLLQEEPVFVDRFQPGWAFDSQNVCFWSPAENCYVLYYRRFIENLRKIYRVTSPDLRTWSEPVDSHANFPGEHLYTNQTQPYFRAPHLYVAFPKRFFPGKVSVDPNLAAELIEDPGYRRDTADAVFMTSRAGASFDRTFKEGFIRPGPSPRDWISRSNAPACGVVPAIGDPRTMFLYRLSHYGQESTHLTRYALRTDGFASLSAGADQGQLITRPVTFEGNQLYLNVATSAGGSVRVELQRPDGTPLPGFALDDCTEIVGDQINRLVSWKDAPGLAALNRQPVRLRFVLTDADLYSFRFSDWWAEE